VHTSSISPLRNLKYSTVGATVQRPSGQLQPQKPAWSRGQAILLRHFSPPKRLVVGD
jgi:hypothetical protein